MSKHHELPSYQQVAYTIAQEAHAGETRADGSPYFEHCYRVFRTVQGLGLRDEATVAALLHDTVEHGKLTLDEIRRWFGARVENMVGMLTPYYTSERFPWLNRAARKHRECLRLATADAETRAIKLADRLDNIATVIDKGEAFARVYVAETRALLEVLVQGWQDDPRVVAVATAIGCICDGLEKSLDAPV